MSIGESGKTIEALLVEDNPEDVRLTQEEFRQTDGQIHLNVVSDGPDAMAFLLRDANHVDAPRPDLNFAGSEPSL